MPIDTVNDLPRRVQYTAGAGATVFDYPFPIFVDGDLVVYVDDTLQALDVDYTVAGEGEDAGGTVTFLSALAGGEIVTIYSDLEISRDTDFQQNGPWVSSSFNDQLDKLTIIARELKDQIGRCIRWPFTATQTSEGLELSPLSNWLGKFLRVSSAGILEAAELVSNVVALTQSLIGELLYPQTDEEFAAGVTPVNHWRKPGDIRRYGATPAALGSPPAADSSAAIRNAILTGHPVSLPEGAFKVTPVSGVGLSLSGGNTVPVTLRGAGQRKTEIWFDTATADDVLLDLTTNNTYASIEDMTLRAVTPGEGWAIRIKDELPSTVQNWKNMFERVLVHSFFKGVVFTTADPTDGLTHAYCSETTFSHCKFFNCRTGVLNRNIQAVNNTFISTDIENDDVGEAYVMIRDEAGGDLKFFGGSLIGRGQIYQWHYDPASTTLFAGAQLTIVGARVECRSVHNGVLFEQMTNFKSGSAFLTLNIRDCNIQAQGQTIDLMRYAGRVNAHFKDCQVLSATLIVRQFPTTGFTANSTTGGQCKVTVENCPNVFFEKETSSPYGTYSIAHSGAVIVQNSDSSTNRTFDVDADSFRYLPTKAAVSQYAYGLDVIPAPQRMIFNDDNLTAGFANILAILPKHARPLKFFMYKHPQRFADAIAYKLYLVKDKADWAGGSFAVGTDAFEVCSIASTANTAGYYEDTVQLVSNSLGNTLTAGLGSWTEGRIFIEKTGGNNMAGFVGVEFA